MKVVSFYLPLNDNQSCYTTSQMTTWHFKGYVPKFEKQQQRTLAVWSLRGEFVKCTWINTTGSNFTVNGLYFRFMLDRWLYFSISAYAALKNEHPDPFVQRKLHCLCHNVTQVVTWLITSYGEAGGNSPPSGMPINRFARKNSFQNWTWKTQWI